MVYEVTIIDSENKTVIVRTNDSTEYTENYDKLVVTTGATHVFSSFEGNEAGAVSFSSHRKKHLSNRHDNRRCL